MATTPTTTIRVSRATRDRLRRTIKDHFKDVPVDEVIGRLLDEHAELMLRKQARIDSRRIADDPVDRAEIEAIARDFGGSDAW